MVFTPPSVPPFPGDRNLLYHLKRHFSKTYPSFLTVKEGSTFLTKPLFPQGREDVTALRCSEPLCYKVGGPSKVYARLCGMGPPWGYDYIIKYFIIRLSYVPAISVDKNLTDLILIRLPYNIKIILTHSE